MYISLSFVPSNDSISLDIQGREELFLFLIYDAQKNLARGAQCVILSNLLCRLVIYTNEIITTQHCWNIYIYIRWNGKRARSIKFANCCYDCYRYNL